MDGRHRERGIDPGPPSDWLTQNRALIGGTRALDLACGTGRNARFLAGLGFTVDTLDISDVAIEALDGIPGVRARVADLERERLPAGANDVVLITTISSAICSLPRRRRSPPEGSSSPRRSPAHMWPSWDVPSIAACCSSPASCATRPRPRRAALRGGRGAAVRSAPGDGRARRPAARLASGA